MRLVGLVFLIAFSSYWVQLPGLYIWRRWHRASERVLAQAGAIDGRAVRPPPSAPSLLAALLALLAALLAAALLPYRPPRSQTSALAALLFSVYVVYAVQLLAVGQHMFAL